MKVKELRALSMPDLRKKLKDSRTELFNLRFQMATGQLQNHRQIRHVRRNLAQILTEIYMKEFNGDAVEAAGSSNQTAGDSGGNSSQTAGNSSQTAANSSQTAANEDPPKRRRKGASPASAARAEEKS